MPLVVQGLPAILLFASMWFCHESSRWLARNDRWDEAATTLSRVRQLPSTHPYVAGELHEISEQLERERRLIGNASFMSLQREMWKIPGNRKRALISIGLMVCQQMTGTNAMYDLSSRAVVMTGNADQILATTTRHRSSKIWVSMGLKPDSSPQVYTG